MLRDVSRCLLTRMTGEGLEPSTNGLTYLIGFHRPPQASARRHPEVAGRTSRLRIESLDYPFAIAGVPRLVSGAGAGSAPVPCLLITQSAGFSNLHARRYQRRCGARGSQGVPAYCGMHSSRSRFFPREAPNGLPPGRIRSPLLYRLSYPVSGDALQIKPRGPTRPDPLRGAGDSPRLVATTTPPSGKPEPGRRAHCLKTLRRSYLYRLSARGPGPDPTGRAKNIQPSRRSVRRFLINLVGPSRHEAVARLPPSSRRREPGRRGPPARAPRRVSDATMQMGR